MATLEIVHAVTEDQLQQARALSRAYITWLIETEESLGLFYEPNGEDVYGYEDGEAQLPGDYIAPHGCLLLALYDSTPAGCVALQKFSEGIGEVRMLFVRPEFQGKGIGKALVSHLVDAARAIGYNFIQLETASYMTDAHRLYRAYGFREIQPYYEVLHSLKDHLLFMGKPIA